jgi:hypothetical protein
MGSYLNSDNLFVKIGVTKATPNIAGEFKTYADRRFIEAKIDLTTLTTANVIQSDQLVFPTGARIEAVTITTLTAAVTGSSALLNVGLIKTADRTTEVDFDGILAAATTANMTLGNEVRQVKGGATAGALVGSGAQATAFPAHLCAATTTGTYSAGLINVRVEYFVP